MAKLTIESLMKLDRDKLLAVPTKEIKAVRLSELLGEDKTVTIHALSGDKYIDLISTASSKKGNVDLTKMYRAQALIVVEAMESPSLKDEALQQHFGAASSVDLAKILFPGGELVSIFSEIAELSGYTEDDDEDLEDEVKN
jgi:hypothetical protein